DPRLEQGANERRRRRGGAASKRGTAAATRAVSSWRSVGRRLFTDLFTRVVEKYFLQQPRDRAKGPFRRAPPAASGTDENARMATTFRKVGVVGAGAVGSFYGAMLARAGHRVVLVGRPVHVDAIRRDGLRL